MSCDEVREQLAEYVLGTLDEPQDSGVRRHLRGCGGCRRDMTALSEGMSTFARAAHELEPPKPLQERVLTSLEQEWDEPAVTTSPPGRRWSRLAWVAAVVAIVGTLLWGIAADRRADRHERLANEYTRFLEVLDGRDVRVGTLRSEGHWQLEGSVVLYESEEEQSWVLVLARAAGLEGEADVTLLSGERTIELHPLDFGPEGEASTWLVTSASLRPFDRVTLTDPSGALLATGRIRSA